jgi:hypothetical protein
VSKIAQIIRSSFMLNTRDPLRYNKAWYDSLTQEVAEVEHLSLVRFPSKQDRSAGYTNSSCPIRPGVTKIIRLALMLWLRLVLPAFFARRTEVADPAVATQG